MYVNKAKFKEFMPHCASGMEKIVLDDVPGKGMTLPSVTQRIHLDIVTDFERHHEVFSHHSQEKKNTQ